MSEQDTPEIVSELFEMSPTIAELAKAFVKAQGTFESAVAKSENPGFKRGAKPSKYADIENVANAYSKQLAANGLGLLQPPVSRNGQSVTIITILIHESGEWIRTRLTMRPTQANPQGVGSAITYGRRYSAQGLLNISVADDDGNAASDKAADVKAQRETPRPTEEAADPAQMLQQQRLALLQRFKDWSGLTTDRAMAVVKGALARNALGYELTKPITADEVVKLDAFVAGASKEPYLQWSVGVSGA